MNAVFISHAVPCLPAEKDAVIEAEMLLNAVFISHALPCLPAEKYAAYRQLRPFKLTGCDEP